MLMVPSKVEPPLSRIANRWRRFRQETRGGGVFYAVHRLLPYVFPGNFLDFGSTHIISLELQDLPAPTKSTACIRPARPEDIDTIVAGVHRRDDLRSTLSRGSQVWIVEQAGKPVAFDVSGAETKYLTSWMGLEAPEGATWAITIWVSPEVRGQGLAGQLRCRVASEIRNAGFVRLLGTIEVTNTRSIRTFRKLGTRFIARVDHVWLFGFGVVCFNGRLQAGRWSRRRPLILPVPSATGAGYGSPA